MKWVEARSGKTLWEAKEYGTTSQAGAEAVAHLGIGLAGKVVSAVKGGTANVVDEITDWDLRDETREAALKLLSRMEKEIVKHAP